MKTYVCLETFPVANTEQMIFKGQVFMVSDPHTDLPMPYLQDFFRFWKEV